MNREEAIFEEKMARKLQEVMEKINFQTQNAHWIPSSINKSKFLPICIGEYSKTPEIKSICSNEPERKDRWPIGIGISIGLTTQKEHRRWKTSEIIFRVWK